MLDVFIRAGLILGLAMLCYRVFSPFLILMVWALILAVTIYPLHQYLAGKIGGRQGLAATLLVVVGVFLIVTPTAMLMSSLGDSADDLIYGVQNNSLQISPPRPGVEGWPIVGKQIHEVWWKAHADLPALVQSMQPKIGEKGYTPLEKGTTGGFLRSRWPVVNGCLEFFEYWDNNSFKDICFAETSSSARSS